MKHLKLAPLFAVLIFNRIRMDYIINPFDNEPYRMDNRIKSCNLSGFMGYRSGTSTI